MKIDVDAVRCLEGLIEAHGTQRAVAKLLGCSEVYIGYLLQRRRKFSEQMLRKLGLRRTIVKAQKAR